jgi:hypothetical protein
LICVCQYQDSGIKRADVSNNSTTITVEEKSTETDEENTYILIAIDEIKGEFSEVNESGEKFKNMNKSIT